MNICINIFYLYKNIFYLIFIIKFFIKFDVWKRFIRILKHRRSTLTLRKLNCRKKGWPWWYWYVRLPKSRDLSTCLHGNGWFFSICLLRLGSNHYFLLPIRWPSFHFCSGILPKYNFRINCTLYNRN